MMTNRTTDTTRTPATTERPWESGIRRGRDTIEVAIPDGRDTSFVGTPIHVEDDGADLGAQYRLRIATRQITAKLEEAVLAYCEDDYGEPCRAVIAELTGHDEMDAGAGRSAP